MILIRRNRILYDNTINFQHNILPVFSADESNHKESQWTDLFNTILVADFIIQINMLIVFVFLSDEHIVTPVMHSLRWSHILHESSFHACMQPQSKKKFNSIFADKFNHKWKYQIDAPQCLWKHAQRLNSETRYAVAFVKIWCSS